MMATLLEYKKPIRMNNIQAIEFLQMVSTFIDKKLQLISLFALTNLSAYYFGV
jgi:hypothetical protein